MPAGENRDRELFFCFRGNRACYFADCVLFSGGRTVYNDPIRREVDAVTVKTRMLALKLMDRLERNPDYARRIGIGISLLSKDPEEENNG